MQKFVSVKQNVHIKTGNIFFDDVNSGESIYDFLADKQSYNQKLLEFTFMFSADFESYVSEYLNAIKKTNDHKYDMLTN